MESYTHEYHSLHYKILGKGKPILLLHGFLEDHQIWNEIIDSIDLNENLLILVDLPCHGLSRFNGEICKMADMAHLLDNFLTELCIDEPYVFGHSMGGYVGLELLKLREIRLTLLHSNFWEDSPSKKEDRNRVVKIVKENKMRLINEAIPNLFAPTNREKCETIIETLMNRAALIPAAEIIAATKGMRDRENLAHLFDLHEINIIHGDSDPIIPNEILDEHLELLTNKPEVHYIKNCGHMSFWENPEALINQLKKIVFS